jgi:hypothetical protein
MYFRRIDSRAPFEKKELFSKNPLPLAIVAVV